MPLSFFKDAFYFKKSRKWLCGRTAEGCPCSKWPDEKGRCQSKYECEPKFDGNRWYCARPEELGGECADGPLPEGVCCRERGYCSPILSVNNRLHMAIIWVSLLTVGLCLFLVFGFSQNTIIDPGPLTIRHSAINDCSACHEKPEHKGLTSMVEVALFEQSGTRLNNSCLQCHDLHMDYGALAHSMPTSRLQDITRSMAEKLPEEKDSLAALSEMMPSAKHMKFSELSCAACHTDHKGTNFDITNMSLKKCNSCHIQKVKTLEFDHPEFDMYPHNRRTRIIYDHNNHLYKYFVDPKYKELAPESCLSCHDVLDNRQPTMLTGYEQTCASCHDVDISNATQAGISVFSVPRLDTETLNAAGKNIGQWPDDTEAKITPFMRVLLSSDQRYTNFKVIEKDENIDLSDLSDASPVVLEAVEGLAWAVKEMLYDIDMNGPRVIQDRLAQVVRNQGGLAKNIKSAVSMLPVDSFRAAQTMWFPDLADEVQAYQAKRRIDLLEPEAGGIPGLPPRRPAIEKKEEEPETLRDVDPVTQEEEASGLNEEGNPLSEDDGDLLDWFSEEPEEDDDSAPVVPSLSAQEWMQRGGWFYDYDSLKYRPTGHADNFVKTWANLMSGHNIQELHKSDSEAVFKKLMLGGKDSLGACSKCHSVDKIGGAYLVNWMKTAPNSQGKAFTKFEHQVHVELTGKENCRHCHVPKRESNYVAGFEDFDIKNFDSNYTNIRKSVCTECHNEQKAQDNCQTCHNYHIERWPE